MFEYLATVDLEAFRELREVRARALVPGVPGYIQGLYLEPVSDGRFTSGVHTSGVPGTFNNHYRPRVTLAGAGPTWGITWLDDAPERGLLTDRGAKSRHPGAGRQLLSRLDRHRQRGVPVIGGGRVCSAGSTSMPDRTCGLRLPPHLAVDRGRADRLPAC